MSTPAATPTNTPRSVTVRVPAKVNVQLAVGGVRPDGFHDLANVFLAVAVYDEVTITKSDALRITASGREAHRVPLGTTNLAATAALLLASRYGASPDVHIHIAKDIPVAGGMAGGSADCAAAVVGCAALWGIKAERDDLLAVCAELGSDVPFSLVGGAALGRGRGERLTPLETGATFHWVFALAEGGLSTPAVYRECDRLRACAPTTQLPTGEPEPAPALLAALRSGDPVALGNALMAGGSSNDLQVAALALRPALADTLRAGTDAGALGAIVSGSGPTCAFLAKNPESASDIADSLLASATCRAVRVARGPANGAQIISQQ